MKFSLGKVTIETNHIEQIIEHEKECLIKFVSGEKRWVRCFRTEEEIATAIYPESPAELIKHIRESEKSDKI